MNWEDLAYKLVVSKYPIVIVTGSERSGTRLGCKILASETGRVRVEEECWVEKNLWWPHVTDLKARMEAFIEGRAPWEPIKPCTIHAPTLFRWIVPLDRLPQVAVVVMRRPMEDIEKSRKENTKVGLSQEDLLKRLGWYDKKKGVISKIQYDFWENKQKSKMEHAFELEYDSMKTHKFWVSPEDREKLRNLGDWQAYSTEKGERLIKRDFGPQAGIVVKTHYWEEIAKRQAAGDKHAMNIGRWKRAKDGSWEPV